MKPFYYLCDFPERKNAGKNFVTECPKCGKKHLHISKETGAFHCFYGGCDFKGKLKDFWETAMTRHPQASPSTAPAGKEKMEPERPHPRYP
mgnify:CR=1 FL=1